MSRAKFTDTIAPDIKFSIVEDNDGVVDGEHVLAKIRGQFFVPDGKSRNGRFYTKSLWERVIKDPGIKNRINKKLMFGTIGHDAELNDRAIREGLVSHFMTKIFINENNKGIGEALILNTPTGKILNTVLRAGSELFVSSRANGTFKGKTKDGLAIVDEETYDIDGWDFVIDPGFLEANPSIAESLEDNLKELANTPNDTGENSMDTELAKHIANENGDLKKQVSDLTDEVTALKEDKQSLTEDNNHLKTEIAKCEDDKGIIESYTALGTVEEITEKLAKAEESAKVLEGFLELADTPEGAKATMENAKTFISTVTEEFGTIEKIREALSEAVEFRKSVDELGSVEKIKEALTDYLEILESKEAAEKEAKTKELAEELGLEVEKVSGLLEKYSEEDVRELYKTVSESKVDDNEDNSNFQKKNFNENNGGEGEGDAAGKVDESSVLGKSRADRMNERFSRV